MGALLGPVPRFGVWIMKGLQGLGMFQAGQIVDGVGNIISDGSLQGPPEAGGFVKDKIEDLKSATIIGLLGFTSIYFGYKHFTKK